MTTTRRKRRLDWTMLTTSLLVTTSIAMALAVARTAWADSGSSTASAVTEVASGSGSGSASASAAPAAPAPAPAIATTTTVTTSTAPATLPANPGFGDIASAFGAGQYALASSLVIIMLVGLARTAGLWKTSKLGGWVLNFAASLGIVLGTAALAHVHIGLAVLGGTVVTAASTAGFLELGRDLIAWWQSRNKPA